MDRRVLVIENCPYFVCLSFGVHPTLLSPIFREKHKVRQLGSG